MDLRLNLLEAFGPEGFHKASPVFLYPPRYVCDAWDKIEETLVAAVANTTTPSILAARAKAVVNYDGRPYLAGIATPTLVLVAQDDILTPVSASEELVSGIVDAKLQVLPYGAHAVSYCEPESFNSAVIPFLRN
jgi:aminoacrylate hydrolase